MTKEDKRIIFTLVIFCSLFVGLIIYMSYFQVFKSESIKNNAYNKRLWINEENVIRGSIIDRNGKILAYSEKKEDSNTRYYPYSNLYSHIIGYSIREYGKAGLELQYNNALLNINENTAINEIKNLVLPSSLGNDLKLTIDHGMQEKSKALLKGRKGAIVTMNPKTGEVYSMVSLPDFDTANLKEQWKLINEDPNSPLMNRATQGLYTPGSIFKVITATAILENKELDKNYICVGSTNIDGYILRDYNGDGHGKIGLSEAFIKSCNTYFADKSLDLEKDRFGNVADRFMINNKIDFDLHTNKSKFPYKSKLEDTEIAASAIGQGKVVVTPLNMALLASAIANDGIMVKPILVKEILNNDGKLLKEMSTVNISIVSDKIIADEIKDLMKDVVSSGTGINSKIKNVDVAGKTGTAENPSGKSHSWFIGFAPANDPKLSVAVILEESGLTGGEGAAPIARDLIIYALNNINF